jgi:hypothetical protein
MSKAGDTALKWGPDPSVRTEAGTTLVGLGENQSGITPAEKCTHPLWVRRNRANPGRSTLARPCTTSQPPTGGSCPFVADRLPR